MQARVSFVYKYLFVMKLHVHAIIIYLLELSNR